MQYLSTFLPVAAIVSGALAAPGGWGADGDACLAAVTGSSALGDAGLRASHCKSYLATTVTPIATETVYITGDAHDNWKRSTVALCPNEVPNYASACDDAHYTSACSVFGFTDVITTTVAATTTTKTIWVKPTGGSGADCSTATVTKAGSTSTVTVGADHTVTSTSTSTITVGGPGVSGTVTVTSTETITKDGSASWTASTVTVTDTETDTVTSTVTTDISSPTSCTVDADLAKTLVDNFVNLLEFTNASNSVGYNQNVSDATLATDFTDISDSINFMSGVALGAVSFTSKAAFDAGQGNQPAVSVTVANIWPGCNSVTWRWRITSLAYPVTGLSHFTVNSEGLIEKNWVEFDNGAWLQGFGQSCAFAPVSVVSPNDKRSLLGF